MYHLQHGNKLLRTFKSEALHPPRDFVRPQLPQDKPVWLEIGAGVGMHALNCAQKNPQIELYALERTTEKFQKFFNAYQVQPSTNLHPIHADAIPWVVHALPVESVERIFILYPNPEPKNPAQRWLNMPFFGFLLECLKPEGEIILASNIPDYIREAKQRAEQVWQLQVSEHVITGTGRTHFEVKYLARSEPCAELRMKKYK